MGTAEERATRLSDDLCLDMRWGCWAGAGKSQLAMSALWALTGQMDERPVMDGRVTEVAFDVRAPGGSSSGKQKKKRAAKGAGAKAAGTEGTTEEAAGPREVRRQEGGW